MREKFHKYFEAFFYAKGKPQPVYIYIFVLLSLVIAMVIMRMCEAGNFSDELILGMCGFIAIWSGIVTAGKRIGHINDEFRQRFDDISDSIKGAQQ